jgi:hypothetical protein
VRAAEAGPQQDGDADDAQHQTADGREGRPVAEQGPEDDDPQRGGGDEQRGQPGVHVLLGDGDQPVAADQQQQPAGDGGASCGRVMRSACRPRVARTTSSSRQPASRNRQPIARNGGRPATVYLIAR